ncbi:hypothetical protein LXL04_003499 [Taraxacum kok-saghyz]
MDPFGMGADFYITKLLPQFLIKNLFSQEEDEYNDDDDDLNGVELNLSLTIGSTNKRRKSWTKKIVYPSSIEIIDLEDSSGIESSDNGVDLHTGEDQPDESFHSNEPSSDLTEEKDIIIPNVIEENAIQKAANSLVLISLQQISTTNHDSESKSGSNDTKIKKPNPRRSSAIDSYESLVLKLEETSVDEVFNRKTAVGRRRRGEEGARATAQGRRRKNSGGVVGKKEEQRREQEGDFSLFCWNRSDLKRAGFFFQEIEAFVYKSDLRG